MTGEAQVRAYLSFQNVRAALTASGSGVSWEIRLSVKNVGQSPAFDVTVYSDVPMNWSDDRIYTVLIDGLSPGESQEVFLHSGELEGSSSKSPQIFNSYIFAVATDVFGGEVCTQQYKFSGSLFVYEGQNFLELRRRNMAGSQTWRYDD